ncbi:hypothetical protein LCGC14_1764930 [marine sediment metagenome]|uniref:Uncharacterized protein n=1 Tax=marine sediment metagenome TaxID=412755 RepID=A0A0F9GZX8_9ZZZZ
MKRKTAESKKLGTVGVLGRYFGKKDGQTISEFRTEIQAMTSDERLELAQGAAQAMGLTESEVQFRFK